MTRIELNTPYVIIQENTSPNTSSAKYASDIFYTGQLIMFIGEWIYDENWEQESPLNICVSVFDEETNRYVSLANIRMWKLENMFCLYPCKTALYSVIEEPFAEAVFAGVPIEDVLA